jgi:hypothetical protein
MAYRGYKYKTKEEALLAQREQQSIHTQKNREHIKEREHAYYLKHQKPKKDKARAEKRAEENKKLLTKSQVPIHETILNTRSFSSAHYFD